MDNGTYSALTIADYIIAHENQKKHPISNLRLQKLLYFVQAQFLFSRGYPCFTEEMEAWDFGPVVPSVYREYKIYGGSQIPYYGDFCASDLSQEDQQLIDLILDHCSGISTTKLVTITHNQDPWKEAYNRPFDNHISNDSIKSFFRG